MIELTEQEYATLYSVAVAAESWIRCVEHANALQAQGAGHLSGTDEQEIAHVETVRLSVLQDAVQAFRAAFPKP